MKKKMLWKNVGLVALSTVMVGGAALAFTACNDSSIRTDYTLSVYIFCGAADATTNRTICENWAREYSAAHAEELGGNTISVQFTPEPSQETYFKNLGDQITSGSYPDIIYVSPSQVLAYADTRILNLTDYITASQETIDMVNSVWSDSLAFYANSGSAFDRTHAEKIAYSAEKGYYDPTTDKAVNIYGLPKDYSNFGLGYNRNYFSKAFKKAYTTLKPDSGANSGRQVQGRIYVKKEATASGAAVYTGKDSDSITYAMNVTEADNYTNPYTGEKVVASADDTAAFINIGIPTAYKPFNFYKYETYDDAYEAGDPLAVSTDVFTDGEGYIVTVPGFPGETFEITAEKYGDAAVNTGEDVAYDTNSGNIVLTWAEYGALNWACAYMLNSFGWDAADGSGMKAVSGNGASEEDYSAWFTGMGGVYTGAGEGIAAYNNVYGGEQYEQLDGGNLYVLPWLFSNDATYVNSDYTKAINEYNAENKQIASANGNTWSMTDKYDPNDVSSGVGYATEDVDKINLDGTTRTAKNQYGINSANFIETYGAFQEYMATWNAHIGQAGDVQTDETDKSVNGQQGFVVGATLFYGVGTWDVSEYQEVRTDILDLGVMPTAVSDKLALYAQGRSAYYVDESGNPLVNTYSNANKAKGSGDNAGTATDGGSGDYEQRSDRKDGLKVYETDEIYRNQVLRQDKWAGRMDSVGYAVNKNLANEGQPAWLAAAAVDLVMELTVGEQSQITLTYGGAQIPNVVAQCSEYLNYNTTAKDGAFKDMITPEGDAQGNDVWDAYYEIALELASAGMDGDTRTVAEALNGKQVTVKNAEGQDVTLDVKYDTQYAGVQLNNFTTSATATTRIAYAMRVLRMINYTRTERDILIRMQTGMNAVRDQTLHTSGSTWLSALNGTSQAANFLAYINQAALGENERRLLSVIAANPSEFGQETSAGSGIYKRFYTPAVYCVIQSLQAQNTLSAGE